MSAHPRPRHLRRRKALRVDHAALHDHDHAHLRGIALVVVVVALTAGGLWRREVGGPASTQDTVASSSERPSAGLDRRRETAEPPGHDYLPLVTIAPEYPPAAEASRISGRCTVEFTVTAAGTTRDVRPVDCQPTGVFEAAAVAAARQFKYRPRERGGDPVEVPGVRNEFVFSLEQ